MMVYYSKLDNAICLEFVEQETTAPKGYEVSAYIQLSP